jgi:hypothetical protein
MNHSFLDDDVFVLLHLLLRGSIAAAGNLDRRRG